MKEEPGGYLGRSGPVLGKCVSPVSDSKEAAVARDREKGPEEDWIRSEDGDFPGGPATCLLFSESLVCRPSSKFC